MGEMQSWGEILCENGTKSVIALKYIMRLQPLYTRALWNHPINYEVIQKIILAEHYSVTSHRTNIATKNNFIILWSSCERKIGAPCLFLLHAPAKHRCVQERGEHGGLLLLIHSAQLTSSACKVFMTWSEPSNTLFLLYAGQQKFLPPIDIAGNCLFLCK